MGTESGEAPRQDAQQFAASDQVAKAQGGAAQTTPVVPCKLWTLKVNVTATTGPRRPKLQDIAVDAFRSFGVATYASPERAAPGGEMSGLWPYVPGVQASDYNVYFHSDHESADTVPWTGLASITRAYAKIIDGVNTLSLSDLQRPPEPPNGAIAPLASQSK